MSQPYKSGRQKNLNLGISSITENSTVLQVTGKVGIGTTFADGRSLYVIGNAEITGVTTLATNGGITTTGGNLFVGKSLYVKDNLVISGLTTFTSDVDIDGSLNVDTNINVVGFSTFNNNVDINNSLNVDQNVNVTGFSTFNNNVDINNSLNVDQNVNVTGLSTFNNNVDINNSLNVDQNVNVVGFSTFNNNVDINSSLNVDQNVTVTGLSTFTGLVDANGGATIDNIRIGVANDNTIDTSTGNLTIDSNGGTVTVTDQLIVTGISTFNNNVDLDNSLNVDQNVTVTGLSTFVGIVTNQSTIFGTNLSIAGLSTFVGIVTNQSTIFGTQLNVSGVSTFVGLVDANGGAEIDNIRIGIANDNEIDTSTGNLVIDSAGGTVTVDDQLIITGISTFNNNVDVDQSLNVDSNLTVTGLSTFVGIVTNQSTIFGTQLSVSGVSTLSANGGITTTGGDLFVGGDLYVADDIIFDEATLRNITVTGFSTLGIASATTLYVAGVSTFAGITTVTGSTLFAKQASLTGVVTANTFRPSSGFIQAADGTNSFFMFNGTGNVAFQGTIGASSINNAQGFQAINFTTNAAPTVLVPNDLNVTGFTTLASAGGITTTGGNLFVGKSLYVKDNLVISGLTTFTSDVDIDKSLNVDQNLTVTGLSTFTGLLDANGGATIDNIRIGVANDNTIDTSTGNLVVDSAGGTLTVNDQLIVVGVSTFNNIVDIDQSLNVDGNLNVTGLSTFVGIVTNQSTIFGKQLNISGISTLNGLLDANGGATIDNIQIGISNDNEIDTSTGNLVIDSAGGTTTIDDQLIVTGITTFNNNVDVDKSLNVDTNLTVTGISTFTGDIDANGSIDVDGHTELDNVNISGMVTVSGLIVQSDFDVFDTTATFHNNVRIDGNLSIGGTATTIVVQDLKIFDKEITLGVTTDAFGNDISTDNTANHGGIAIASTEGSPLVSLKVSGINTMPDTYKQIMWVKHNTMGAGTTDAWLFNYAVGVGSTLVPNGVRFAVSQIQFSDDAVNTPNLNVAKNVTVTGLSTFTGFVDANGGLDVSGGSTLDRLNVTGVSTFAGITTVTGSTLFTKQINVAGVSTFQSDVNLKDNVSLFFGDGQDLKLFHDGSNSFIQDIGTGGLFIDASTTNYRANTHSFQNSGSTETLATFNSDGSVVLFFDNSKKFETSGFGATVYGTLDSTQLNVTGVSTLASLGGITTTGGDLFVGSDLFVKDDIFSDEITSRNINVTGVSTLGVASATTLFVSGVSTFSSFIDVNGGLDVIGGSTLDNLNVTGLSTFVGITTNQSTLFTRQINALGLSTFIGLTTSTSTLFANQFSVVGPSTFVGITTAQSTLFANQLSVSGFSTLTNLKVTGLTPNGTDFGGPQYLLRADGSGGWAWADVPGIFSVNNILNGFNVSDEGLIVGTAGSITQLDFRGNNIVATADTQPNGIATIRVSDTPSFLNLTVTPGISTLGVTTSTSLFSNQLSVSGLSTFIGVGTFVGDLFVGGDLYVADDLIFDSFTAREITVTEKSSLGIASATTLRVTGISTFANVDASTINVTGIVTASTFNGNVNSGVGTITTLNSTTGNITTLNATTANILTGIVTSLSGTNLVYSGVGTINTLRSNVGIITELTATSLNVTGISTFVGITTQQSTLFANQLSVVGASTFIGLTTSTSTLFAKQLSVVGPSTFIGEITNQSTLFANQLNVSGVSTHTGISTFQSTLFANQLSVVGPSTFVGVTTSQSTLFANQLNVVGPSTFVGVTTSQSTLFANQLSVAGVATVTNGPLLIGSGTSTGTTTQPLQVTGGAYVSGRVGIGTTLPRSTYKVDIIGDVNFDGNLYQNNTRFVAGIGIGSTSVNPSSSVITQRIGVGFTDLNIVGSGISVTGYGSTIVVDFSTLSAAAGALSISTSTVSVPQDITFVGGAGTSIIGIATVTDRFVYVPSTGRVGIGTSAPAYKLDVIGDINSSTSVKIKGVDVLEEAVRLAIALG